MNKNLKYALIFTGVVAGSYIVVKILKTRGVKESKKSDEEEGLKEPEKKIIIQTEPKAIVNLDFIEKAKTLQGLLGFTGRDIDGDIGKNTKARLANKGITYEVTPSNIDAVITQLRQNISAPELIKARKARASNITRAAAQQIKMAYTWTDNPASLPVYNKDALGNFNKDSTFINVNKTTRNKIFIFGQVILENGFIRARIRDKEQQFIIVSPYSITIY